MKFHSVQLASAAIAATLSVCLGALATQADATTVTIPDLAPKSFIYYGNGDVSVTYSGVTFIQNTVLGNANLYNIGSNYDIGPVAVLSSQQEMPSQQDINGLANILIDLPKFVTKFSVGYGTFHGADVKFQLSNGDSFTQSSVGGLGYTITNIFSVNSTPFNSVLVTSPDFVLDVNDIEFSAVPEPVSWAMMLVGLGGLGAAMRMSRRENGAALAHA